MGRYFGTDGIRGKAGEGPLSTDAMMALGRVLGGQGGPVLIGRDSRTSGPMLQAALTAGLLEAGADVVSGGLLPTPCVASAVAHGPFVAGVVISASHNPPADNGIKLLGENGHKLSGEIERKIEAGLVLAIEEGHRPQLERCGTRTSTREISTHYIDHLVKQFDDAELQGMNVVLDCARGAACHVGPALYARLGLRVRAVNERPDGARINENCGALAPLELADLVRATEADLGVCLDGDADRAMLLDSEGQLVDGDMMLALCALERQQRHALPVPVVVGTVMSNLGLERLLSAHDIRLERAPVGDIPVGRRMDETGAVLGGEESGHILFRDGDHPFGDGLHTALQVMATMRRTGKPLTELADLYTPCPQARRNLGVTDKPPLDQIDGLADLIERCEASGQRVLIRYSGTEPKARVLVEDFDAAAAETSAEALSDLLVARIGRGDVSSAAR